MKVLTTCFIAALFLPLTTTHAQEAPQTRHSGFHASFGLGAGSAALTCSGCDSDRETSSSMMLRFGGAVSPNVVLSGEISGWSKEKNGVSTTLSFLTLAAQIYPDQNQGFVWKFGAGFVGAQSSASGVKVEASGFGLTGGLGYDIALTPGFSLTPYGDIAWMSSAEAKVNGSNTGISVGANLIHIGLAASWR
jgi:hypothetical protein